jgi:RHS repeat-associated protein
VGNITYTIDRGQPTIIYNNQQVLCEADLTYDALYRLIRATGREQIAQNTVDETPTNSDYRNYPFDAVNPLPAPTDGVAMRPYTQLYSYDPAGNMTKLQHVAGTGSYTRVFAYNNNTADRITFGVPSTAVMNNQLLATILGGSPAVKYSYDGHGNLTNLFQHPALSWDFKDEFVSYVQQIVGGGTGQTTYYNYDSSGNRTRKVSVGAAPGGGKPALLSERLYLGNYEIYRTYDNTGKISLQRESLHLMDDESRIVLIDNKTLDTENTDSTKLNTYYPRYQYGNHLNSAIYELDGNGVIISYEEYHPFGTSSYQAADAALDVPVKRYRYTGKERDEESGLYYHGARYYAPWLCRWTAADPIGIGDGLNLYSYVNNNPVVFSDPRGTECDSSTTTCEESLASTDSQLVNQRSSEVDFEIDQMREGNQTALEALRSGKAEVPKIDPDQFAKDMVKKLKQADSPQNRLEKQLTQAENQRQAEYQAELKKEAELDKKLPGMGESLIPVWGSGKSSIIHFSEGNYVRGVGYGALAISDVFLVKSLLQGGTKLTLKLIGAGARTVEAGETTYHAVAILKSTTVDATKEETELYLKSIATNTEFSRSETFAGQVIEHQGQADKVYIEAGPNIKSTLHTHPQSRIAQFSMKDIRAYQEGRYVAGAKHSVLGLKWPSANRILIMEGAEEALDVVKTTGAQAQVDQYNLRYFKHTFQF